ncbi:hypothetical protein KUV62_00640 [Salipiger bermudensis]|uniref:hypothetical protein n=1 Tax=Salipiger bermudensis TaxID=344736 RepID=UPI001C9954FF|nr:hypothetical protein [Salipiger bermudensis]MBY6002394.1 hypothetical protein [Salipiger bermudensis]
MLQRFQDFLSDESGAITVDWVVLTASVVAMAAISFYQIRDNSANLESAAGNAVADEQARLFPD